MVTEKCCRRCGVVKPAREYRADNRYRDGLGSWCASCHRERNSEWARENRGRLSEKTASWRAANPEKVQATNARSKRKHATRLAEQNRQWGQKNRDKRRATTAKRKAAKLRATPRWADIEAIREVYSKAAEMQAATGVRMHVDHVVPLQHPLVCGLHCEANLQVIDGAANEAKKNYWWPDCAIRQAYAQPSLFEPQPENFEQQRMFGAETEDAVK